MRIESLSPIDSIQPERKTGRVNRAGDTPKADSINISSEAAQKSELHRVREMVSAAPDVRMDRVEELRAKINDPAYIDDRVINATADRIIDSLFG